MNDFPNHFPITVRVLQREFENGAPGGAQIHISLGKDAVADVAFGEARPGRPMQTQTILPWRSAGKPVTALAVAQLFEKKLIDVDASVARYLPAFGQRGKELITIRQLLTHTGGFRSADKIPENLSWDETLACIYETSLEPNWIPGKTAGYHTSSSWFVLGEIVQRLTGRPIAQYVRKHLFEPLGMNDSRLSFPPGKIESSGETLGWMHVLPSGWSDSLPSLHVQNSLSQCRPGSSACGPIRELAILYKFLLNPDPAILKPETARLFTARQRAGLFDLTFQHTVDFGLGFIMNSNRHGTESVPYGYGRHCSEETFGHSGAQSSCAFADPKHQLIVAWIFNTMPGERPHQKRAREINSAIYEDLGLDSAP